jgi:hypothetical protein
MRKAEPIERAELRDQRGGVTVADDCVVFNQCWQEVSPKIVVTALILSEKVRIEVGRQPRGKAQ